MPSTSIPLSLANVALASFVSNYAFPAFVIDCGDPGVRQNRSLSPIYGNAPFRSLILGPDSDGELDDSLLKSLKNIQQAQMFSVWVEKVQTSPATRESRLLVDITPLWRMDTDTDPPVTLELTGTRVERFLVCTTIPQTPMPKVVQRPSSSRSFSRSRDLHMKLPDFPAPVNRPYTTGLASPVSSTSSRKSHSPDKQIKSTLSSGGVMREMIATFDWSQTPLGPREAWPVSLKTILSMMLNNPFPQAIWWGPELTLIYNDAYIEVAGNKHPRIFGLRGSTGWGEIWDSIGPHLQTVFGGKAISKNDDLLFFNRLTERNLPEECYNSWSWVPVYQEDGSIGGLVNSTFDTTSKVITERRLVLLRELNNNAALAKTMVEFVTTTLGVLEQHTLDIPFAAMYSMSSKRSAVAETNRKSRTSYIQNSVNDSLFLLDLVLKGTVAIPSMHPSVPQSYELLLDPVTLNPSPRSSATSGSSRGSTRLNINPNPSIGVAACNMEVDSVTPSGASSMSSGASNSSSPPISSNQSTSNTATATPAPPPVATIWPFAEAISSRRPVYMADLPVSAIEGFELRGWEEHARQAVVIPIGSEDSDWPNCILILGLNTRRPYDKEYKSWIELLHLSLNSLFTAVKGREADITRAEQLAELDDAKTAFFSNASHELRTPLTLISAPIQDCLSLTTEPKVKEHLKLASRHVVRLTRLVDSLMDVSKLAAKKLDGRFRPVDLSTYTFDVASSFRTAIEKESLEYIVECDNSQRMLTYVDPEFWEKIVYNIIGNAFKYTMTGFVKVSLHFDNEYAYFRVQDSGVGIPQEDIEKIFERFHRVVATSRSSEGTGIGLALTKELVKLHGGTITVQSTAQTESERDHGSTFTVSIPLGNEHLVPSQINHSSVDFSSMHTYARGIVDEAAHWSIRTPNDGTTPSDSTGSESGGSSESGRVDPGTLFFVKNDIILLVDDSTEMRRYIKTLFTPYCRVVEAKSGQEALVILETTKPTLILSDVMMPGLGGYGLIKHVRSRPDTKLIPIILVTAKENEEARVEGLLSGADDYLGKPFKSRELIARVHLQMQLGKKRIELEAKFLERSREMTLLSDLSPVGILRADTDGRVIYVNKRWSEISGHNKSNVPIEQWQENLKDDDRSAVYACWNQALDGSQNTALEFQFKNGTFVKGQFGPVIMEGICIGLMATLTDVSDQRLYEASRLAHAQEREASARKRAEEAELSRQEADERRRGQELLIDVTSHELRQPVSAILNCSSLVRSNLASLRQSLGKCHAERQLFTPYPTLLGIIDADLDALDAIYQCGLAQERIANDVLSLSRIQLQVLSIHPVEFNLAAEVERIVSIFRNEVKMKKINLKIEVGKSIKVLGIERVCCDKARFGQVVTNLLSNGIKFTDTSSGARDILVTVNVARSAPEKHGPCIPPPSKDDIPLNSNEPTQIFVYVAVKDSGPGLKQEDLLLLFQRFQQGSNSHNVFGGSGLGLFVSRKLCDLMGGRIDVDSVFGKGATFRFFIEATTAPPATAEEKNHASSSVATSSRPAPDGPRRSLSALHILITEDNLINQTVLDRQLKQAGFTTALASNGRQAIEQIVAIHKRGRKFDVILMDCEMPVMDGLAAVREIRRLEAAGEIRTRNKICALTGNARDGQVQNTLDAGMDDVVIKPYKLPDLIAKLHSLTTS